MLPLPMQDSLPAGWLAFTGRELNPLDRVERFQSCYISSPFPGFILTLRKPPTYTRNRFAPMRAASVLCVNATDLPRLRG
jgi:hypothetical protein